MEHHASQGYYYKFTQEQGHEIISGNREKLLIINEEQKQPLEVFHKKDVHKNFGKIHRKTPFMPQPATLLEKRLWETCFPVNFAKFLKEHLFFEHLWATASGRNKPC